MSDGDLDDFFAKKDKNRKKKTKGISNEDFVSKYEAKCKDSNNKENKSAIVLNNLEGFIQDDGEWKDFEDEQKDYSGLKIQALIINDDEQREKEEEDIKKESTETPWGKKEENEDKESPDKSEEEPEKEPEKEEKEPADEAPLTLDLNVNSIAAALKLSREKKIKSRLEGQSDVPSPRIDDAAEFPDLGATPEDIQDAKTFQPVRSIGGSNRAPAPPLPNQQHRYHDSVSTDNKFSALRNNY